MDNQQGATD